MKIARIIMLVVGLSSFLAALHIPLGSCASSRVYVSPSSSVFFSDTTVVDSEFNVTVFVENVSDLAGWQVRMAYNSSVLNCTRAWEPTWDGKYVFYGRNTFPMTYFDSGYALLGDVLIPLNQAKFAGTGQLCIVEFEIVARPSGGGELSSTLDITNSTKLLDSHGNEISVVITNGFCRYINRSLPISSFQTFFVSNPRVVMVYPFVFSNKPLGCGAAMLSDWTASGFIYATLKNVTLGLDIDPSFVDQTQGKVYGNAGAAIVSFGGPLVNLVTLYSENNRTTPQNRGPIEFYSVGGMLGFQFLNGTSVPGGQLNESSINFDKDMFVIESYMDGDGRYLMLCYGLGWKGTYAAGIYFNDIIYANLQSNMESWIIVKWEDTNGDGSVNSPSGGDSYSVVAKGN